MPELSKTESTKSFLAAWSKSTSSLGRSPILSKIYGSETALGNEAKADEKLSRATQPHPFRLKYHQEVRASDWERCRSVLAKEAYSPQLLRGWQ